MLLTKEVKVIPSGKSIQYYRNLGYDAKYLKPLTVKIEDLQKNSDIKIQYLCDYCCKEILNIRYADFTHRTNELNKRACKNCLPQMVKEICLLRYGVDNYAKTKECHEKMESTMEKLYGVKHALQNKDILASCRNTCVEKYGEDYAKQFTEKAFETFREKTGYNYPSQSPEVREKITQSFLEHYGVFNGAQSPEVREKITQTLYANSSQKASKQQRYINELYQGILNFPVKYYNVDICLSDDNIIVEYDGGFHMGNVVTGRETIEEYKRKEIIRNNIIKREGYKQIRIISSKDLLPSDPILLQMLSEAKQYFSETAHSWMTFDIDNSRMINAENRDTNGILYDFGTLRRIKDSDLPEIENNNNTNLKGGVSQNEISIRQRARKSIKH